MPFEELSLCFAQTVSSILFVCTLGLISGSVSAAYKVQRFSAQRLSANTSVVVFVHNFGGWVSLLGTHCTLNLCVITFSHKEFEQVWRTEVCSDSD